MANDPLPQYSRDTGMVTVHLDGETTSFHPIERLCRLCPGFDAHYEALVEMEKRAIYCESEAEPSGYGEQDYARWILRGGEYPK